MAVDLLARCVRGLEWVAAAEVSELPGVAAVTVAPREVSFRLPALEQAVLDLRTVDDVFVAAGSVPGIGPRRDALAGLATGRIGAVLAAIDWVRTVRPLQGRPSYDVVASLAGRHTYNRYAAEDALAQALALRLGRYLSHDPDRRSAEPERPELTIRMMVRDSVASLAVRVAAVPLHRRGYKQRTGPATLHPPVAAAMAALAGPGRLLDPCCGDGTIAIEFARMCPGHAVVAADLSAGRAANAVANAAAAGTPIAVAVADAAAPPVTEIDRIVTNPPWSRSVDLAGAAANDPAAMWQVLGELLDRDGSVVVIGAAEYGVAARLRTAGLRVGIDQPIRLAGRVSNIVLAAPPGGSAAPTGRLDRWRRTARAAGVLTDTGF
ncbi:MAG: methyltransferase [Mycobacteriales bacterium]